jgi:anti-sigma-K factor RskA
MSVDLNSTSRHADPEDLALFAMQLLTADEAAAIAQHVEQCEECRRELAQLQGDLGVYASTVERNDPPAAARQHLLRQIAREKKVVPISQPISQPAIASYGRGSSLFGAAEEEEKPERHVGRAILGWAGWAIAAGLAVAMTFLYKDRNALHGALAAQTGLIARLSAEADNSHQLMDALIDPKAERVTLTAKPAARAPSGRVTYNADNGKLVFLASDLDPLQLYKTYELWILPADGSAPIPAGTFHPDDQGNASLILPELPKGASAKGFGVTIEDDGGSQTPTKPIVLSGF